MSWATISDAQVLAEFTPQEKTAINAIQGASTNLAAVRGDVVGAWRGAISAAGHEVSATAATVPDQFRPYIIAIIRWNWLVSLPSLKAMQTKERADAAKRAEDKLAAVEAGDVPVESPDATPANPASGTWNSENRMDMRTAPLPRPPSRESTDSANPAND